MKRALAERAKQQGGGAAAQAAAATDVDTAAVEPSSSSSPSSLRPLKIPRLQEPQSDNTSSRNAAAAAAAAAAVESTLLDADTPTETATSTTPQTTTTTPTTSLKRPRSRPSLSQHHDNNNNNNKNKNKNTFDEILLQQQKTNNNNDDDNSPSAFYLKQQNRALASEWKQLQYQLGLLESERTLRRRQCQMAVTALRDLHTQWTDMERVLCRQTDATTTTSRESTVTTTTATTPLSAMVPDPNSNTAITMLSTGTGDSVELTHVLWNSLTNLATTSSSTKNDDDDEGNDTNVPTPPRTATPAATTDMDEDHLNTGGGGNANQEETDGLDLGDLATALSKRVAVLHEWIQMALQRNSDTTTTTTGNSTTVANSANSSDDMRSWQTQVVSLQSQLQEAQGVIRELAITKDEAIASERKVRRGLYRLASGRMQLPEVLKAVELDPSSDEQMIQDEAIVSIAATTTPTTGGSSAVMAKQEDQPESVGGDTSVVQKQLQDVEEIASSRQEQIAQLLQERESLMKRVTELSLRNTGTSSVVRDEDIQQSSLFTKTATQLATATRQVDELRTKLKDTLEKYATVKGDADLATKTLEEHLSKFQKRWTELTGGSVPENGNHTLVETTNPEAQAKRIVELEHKLKQALENVRQSDIIRTSLTEAHQMNEFLQGKLEEFKVKNATLVASKSAARSSSVSDLASKDTTTSKPATPHTPMSTEKSEKLQKEHRRMKKELAAALVSKENAKEKQMRAEKERDTLIKTNSRLLKQSAEKDDMNAKSLSTILHLKHMTEQLSTEKGLLEQETKSAEQLALAARLATNAKDRVAEEVLQDKEALKKEIETLESRCEDLQQARERTEANMVQKQAELNDAVQRVRDATRRCDELASLSSHAHDEKRTLLESLAVAQRQVLEQKASQPGSSGQAGGGGAPFPVSSSSSSAYASCSHDELVQFVSALQSRVRCGVCNERDKQVMIVRCRHLFCSPCVDENIKNRSRKCPACGQRFDTKDVEPIWL